MTRVLAPCLAAKTARCETTLRAASRLMPAIRPVQRQAVPLATAHRPGPTLLGCDDLGQSVAPVVVPAARQERAGYHRGG